MPTYIRVKDLPNAATSPAADDFILLSGTANGARKISRSDFIAAIASQIVAAPSTYKIATLDGADKLTSSQDPSQSVSYLGGHDMVANSPALADGSGTAGDTYYVTNPGTRNYGSGNITAQEGDALVYSGSVWQLVEGIANILDGISTASTARTTLEVNSKDEDAQANALKTTAPALYFNGTSSVATVAQDPKLSFTDGVNDTGFSFAFKCRLDSSSAVDRTLISKFNLVAAEKEYRIYHASNNRIYAERRSTSGADFRYTYSTANPITVGEWAHVVVVFNAAGPDTSTTFANATQQIFVNGIEVTDTSLSTGTYTGMSSTNGQLRIGAREGQDYWSGHISDVKIFNKTLTSTEIAELARGNDLGFVDEWGGALGGLGTIDETVGLSSWSGSGSATATNLTETANTTVGGRPNVLRQQATATVGTATKIAITSVASVGKRVRIEFDYYINSGNVTLDTIIVASPTSAIVTLNTAGAWTRASIETVLTSTTVELQITDGASYNATALDFVGIDNFSITEIGTLADFRAEDYNESASKLLDRSSNNFVGVGTSVTLTGNQRHISADTIDLKNLPTSSAGLSAGEVWSNGGVLTVV